jgi:malonate transporter
LIAAVLVFYVLPLDSFPAKVVILAASLPLGASAFVLAQRYKALEVETSCSAVLSTLLSVLTVSVVMALLEARLG